MKKALLLLLAVITIGVLLLIAVIFVQGRRQLVGTPDYVALGSSYAAGSGIGGRAPGSPLACFRGEGSYPRRLSRLIGRSLVDVTCGGATAHYVLHGGQYFQRPQIDAVKPSTQLVTLTIGGNDIFFAGDLLGMAKGNEGGALGPAIQRILGAPHAAADRDYAKVEAGIIAIVRRVRQRAPGARVVVASYPAAFPAQGSCAALGLTPEQVALLRPVASQLASATRRAARASGATLVDMAVIGIGHDACSREPWISGAHAITGNGGAFHPTRLGAEMTARHIARVLAQP